MIPMNMMMFLTEGTHTHAYIIYIYNTLCTLHICTPCLHYIPTLHTLYIHTHSRLSTAFHIASVESSEKSEVARSWHASGGQLIVGLSTMGAGFDPFSVRVRQALEKVELRLFCEDFGLSTSVSLHQCSMLTHLSITDTVLSQHSTASLSDAFKKAPHLCGWGSILAQYVCVFGGGHFSLRVPQCSPVHYHSTNGPYSFIFHPVDGQYSHYRPQYVWFQIQFPLNCIKIGVFTQIELLIQYYKVRS